MEEPESRKENVLDELENLLREGKVTRKEVLERIRRLSRSSVTPKPAEKEHSSRRKPAVSRTVFSMFVVLSVIVATGGFLWWQWHALSRLARSGLSLGLGSGLFLVGWITDLIFDDRRLSNSCYGLSGIVLPAAMATTYFLYGFEIRHPLVISQITGLLFLLYLSFYLTRLKQILLGLTILYGSSLFIALSNLVGGLSPLTESAGLYYYQALVLGVIWIFLAIYSSPERKSILSSFLYGAGSVAILTGGLLLGGGWDTTSYYWQLLFPLLVLIVYILALTVQNRFCLVSGSIFLLFYLARLSAVHFKEIMGEPAAAIIFAFAAISVGSVTILLYSRISSFSD